MFPAGLVPAHHAGDVLPVLVLDDGGVGGAGGGGGAGRPLLAARHPAPHARLGGEEGKVAGVKEDLVFPCNIFSGTYHIQSFAVNPNEH